MSEHRCCHRHEAHRPTRVRRGLGLLGWVAPSAMLALMPKCPICVAGYVALVSGVGISISTAYYLRVALITLCITSLASMAARQAHRHILRRYLTKGTA